MSNQLAVKNKEWLKSDLLKQQVGEALPQGFEVKGFMRCLYTAVQKVPKLMNCTRESLYSCIIDSAQIGLEPDGRNAHLIPYGNKCTLIPDYKGLVQLAYRNDRVSNIHADVICKNDDFIYNMGRIERHSFKLDEDRGNVIGAYAYCRFSDGSEKYELMSIKELDAIRARSKSGNNGPWVTDTNEMYKKTVFKRMSKWLPLASDVIRAIEKDDEDYMSTVNEPKSFSQKEDDIFEVEEVTEEPSEE